MSQDKTPSPTIIWMDLEMTGLDPEVDEIIEIASIVTDAELNIIAEGPELVIRQPPERFDRMDDWNRDQHAKSGLWAKVIASTISIEEATAQTLAFVKQYAEPRTTPLAGNSIWQDRRFIHRYMKDLDQYLHYRMIDVSSFKEMVRRWYPNQANSPGSKNSHRALEDIRESISELKFYRDNFFLRVP